MFIEMIENPLDHLGLGDERTPNRAGQGGVVAGRDSNPIRPIFYGAGMWPPRGVTLVQIVRRPTPPYDGFARGVVRNAFCLCR